VKYRQVRFRAQFIFPHGSLVLLLRLWISPSKRLSPLSLLGTRCRLRQRIFLAELLRQLTIRFELESHFISTQHRPKTASTRRTARKPQMKTNTNFMPACLIPRATNKPKLRYLSNHVRIIMRVYVPS